MKYPEDFIDKVICGDCLDIMRKMPDESVDLCIADPPFNIGKDYGKFDDGKNEEIYWHWIESRIKEIYRVLKQGSRFYIFHIDDGIFKLRPICEKYDFKFHQLLIWYRPNLIGRKRIGKSWNCMHENILLFHKGKRTKMLSNRNVNCFNVFIYPSPQSNFKGGRDHAAQKPIGLLADMISRTPGEIILDPFCGVGTSLIAAKNLSRNFIGIEINQEYCNISNEKLKQGIIK